MKTAVRFLCSLACFLGMSCLPLSASPLLGSWYADDATGSAVVTFLPNNEFVFIQDGDPTVDPTGQDGIERGTFVWNPTTGAFASQVTLDTNKAWGFSNGIAGVPGITFSVVADTLTVTIPGEGDFSLARVRGSNPLVGAWWTLDAAGSDQGTVVTFLPDERFFLARDGDPVADPGGNDGMEAGTWSWNALTGALTTTVQTDTNGTWGLSHAGAVKTIAMQPRAQRLIYTQSADPSPSTFYRIRPISFSAWISEQGLTGSSALQLSKPFANGFENILLYAMNLDGTSTAGQYPRAETLSSPSGRQLQMDYRLRSGLYGVSLIPQYSSDLVTWSEVPDSMVHEIGMADAETSLLRATIPSVSGKNFGRLKAIEMSITAQPIPTTITSGGTTTLTVAVAGSSPTSYQWYQGPLGETANPVGTNSASFTTPALTSTTSYWARITSAAGSINSTLATVTVNQPVVAPGITTQPASITITSGSTATLTVAASGTAPLTYQWYQGYSGLMTTPVGENSPSFTTPVLTTLTFTTFQNYWVRVSNAAGSVDSAAVTVTVTQPVIAPSITTQPAATTINLGQTVTLSVSASGTSPRTFQWYQGAVGTTTTPVGTNSASLTMPSLTATTSFWVRVSNSAGSADSLSATVTVLTAPAIITQPSSTVINSGSTATLSVSASGSAPLTYQWYQGTRSSTTYPVGSNSSSFTTAALTSTTSYWVRVSNALGSVDSSGVTAVMGSEMSLITAGSFTMGRTAGDTDSNAPSVTVDLSGFYMGRYEVTKSQWDEVRTWGAGNGYTDLPSGGGKTTNHPVTNVSWWSAVKWCNARSEKEGLSPVYVVAGIVMKTGNSTPTVNWSSNGYRLPTEAEWEKAARGGAAGKRFPWGSDTISHSDGNFLNDGGETYQTGTTGYHPEYARFPMPYTSPIGSFSANGYGLHDVAGNVCEWCWDWYSASSYVSGASDPRGAASGSYRVFRGGSWFNSAYSARASVRASDTPDYSHYSIGFRVARSSVP